MGALVPGWYNRILLHEHSHYIPRTVKPYLLPIWTPNDCDDFTFRPQAPLFIYFSGSTYTNKKIEKKVRKAQSKYAFSAVRCIDEETMILKLFEGTVPCMILLALWMPAPSFACDLIPITNNHKEVNLQLRYMFKLLARYDLPPWWIRVKNKKELMNEVKRYEFCLTISTSKPVWYVHQVICSKLGSYFGRFRLIQVKKRQWFFSNTYCILWRKGLIIEKKACFASFRQFINHVNNYMKEAVRPEPKKPSPVQEKPIFVKSKIQPKPRIQAITEAKKRLQTATKRLARDVHDLNVDEPHDDLFN